MEYDYCVDQLSLSQGRIVRLHYPRLLTPEEAQDVEESLLLTIKGIKKRAQKFADAEEQFRREHSPAPPNAE